MSEYSPRKLVIVEEVLRGPSGHFFQWNKAIKELNEAEGYRVRVYGHEKLDDALAGDIGAVRHFRHSWRFRDGQSQGPLQSIRRFFFYTWQAWKENGAILEREGHADCVLISSVRIHQLIAWYFLCRKHLGTSIGRVFFFVIAGQASYAPGDPTPRFNRAAKVFRFFLRRYGRWVAEGRVCFATDSDETARQYHLLAGVPFEEVPSPAIAHRPRRSRAPGTNEPVSFVTLGPVRHEKGSDLFHEAIRRYLQQYPQDNVRFVFHWPNQMRGEADRPVEPDPALREDERVRLLTGFLTSEQYEEELLNAHCVVLPYRWSSYFQRQSNLVAEAGTAGIPMIVTDDTWLSRAVDRWAHGMKVPDGDVAALVEAMHTMALNIDEHLGRAEARREAARAFNAPERFQAFLWGDKQ